MSDKEAIDIELAKEKVQRRKDRIAEGTTAGFRAADAINQAERQTVMDIMVRAGICTEVSYLNTFSENLESVIGELAGAGILDEYAYIFDDEAEDAA